MTLGLAPVERVVAACQGLDVDPAWWDSDDTADIIQAVAACHRCPIEQECLIWALRTRQRPRRGGSVFGGFWFAGTERAS